MNVGKSKVMRCSRYGNGDRMYVILNGEPLEEVDYFKYLGSQVAADGGCERDLVHRMNEGYRAWGKQGKVFYGQEPPSGESTTTECGLIINYLQ